MRNSWNQCATSFELQSNCSVWATFRSSFTHTVSNDGDRIILFAAWINSHSEYTKHFNSKLVKMTNENINNSVEINQRRGIRFSTSRFFLFFFLSTKLLKNEWKSKNNALELNSKHTAARTRNNVRLYHGR